MLILDKFFLNCEGGFQIDPPLPLPPTPKNLPSKTPVLLALIMCLSLFLCL